MSTQFRVEKRILAPNFPNPKSLLEPDGIWWVGEILDAKVGGVLISQVPVSAAMVEMGTGVAVVNAALAFDVNVNVRLIDIEVGGSGVGSSCLDSTMAGPCLQHNQ